MPGTLFCPKTLSRRRGMGYTRFCSNQRRAHARLFTFLDSRPPPIDFRRNSQHNSSTVTAEGSVVPDGEKPRQLTDQHQLHVIQGMQTPTMPNIRTADTSKT